MRKVSIPFIILFLSAFLYACFGPDRELAEKEWAIAINEVTTEAGLGRVLFYDKALSVNNSVSCGSCHKQAFAFADNVALSKGFDNQLTERNSMPLQDLGFSNNSIFRTDAATSSDFRLFHPGFPTFSQNNLFWDGRASDLNIMVLMPVVNHREMGVQTLEALREKVAAIPYYQTLFPQVFEDEDITLDRIGMSIAAFIGQFGSSNTKLDRAMMGQGNLTALELVGQTLFVEKYECNACHQIQSPFGYLFVEGGQFANVGLNRDNADKGLGNVTGVNTDNGKFKIPSLRNVALTGPYMHDGRFTTLEEVLDHYSTEMKPNPNLDFRLRDEQGAPLVLNITQSEKKAIIAFLHTLTDPFLITNPDFSNPFKTN